MLDFLNRYFTSPVMIWGVLAVGLLLAFCTRFIQFRRLFYTLRYTFSQMFCKRRAGKGITSFQAVTTALSGTLGTGNIAGVAAAVSIGGPGALFWMWAGAFLGMATKYSEIVLAVKFRQKSGTSWIGGPMHYIGQAMGGKKLAGVFAFACIFASFFCGNMVQSNTAAASLRAVTSLPEPVIRALFLLLALLIGGVVLGGIGRIARTTELLVPAMALFYIGGCIVVLVKNWSALPAAFGEIFASAFSLRGMAGGFAGCLMIRALKIGFSRGVLTNEAGLGSAPIAHAAADCDLPGKQGLWGIFEVFLDTIVMCTLTGLVVIVSGLWKEGNPDGAAITLAAFDRWLGGFASLLIGVSTVFFAAASIIGWCYYGESCIRYLFAGRGERKAVFFYKLLYVAAVYQGAVSALELIWGLTDLCNGLMMVPNLIGVALLAGVVRSETRKLDEAIARERGDRRRGKTRPDRKLRSK